MELYHFEQKKLMEIQLDENNLKQQFINIYNQLNSQQNSILNLATLNKNKVSSLEISNLLVHLVDQFDFSSYELTTEAQQRILESDKYKIHAPPPEGFDDNISKLGKRFRICTSIFDIFMDRFNSLDKSIENINKTVESKVNIELYEKEQDQIISQYRSELDVSINRVLGLQEGGLTKMNEKLIELNKYLNTQEKETQWKLNDFKSKLQEKISDDVLETYKKVFQNNLQTELKKQNEVTVTKLQNQMLILTTQNQIFLNQVQHNMDQNNLDLKNLHEYINSNLIHKDTYNQLKISQDERQKEVNNSFTEINRKLETLNQLDSLQKGLYFVQKECADFRKFQQATNQQIEDCMKSIRTLDIKLFKLDFKPEQIDNIEIQIAQLKEKQINMEQEQEKIVQDFAKQLECHDQKITTQIAIFNETIFSERLTHNDIINLIEKEIVVNKSLFRSRIVSLIQSHLVLPNGTPYHIQIQNHANLHASSQSKIEQIESQLFIIMQQTQSLMISGKKKNFANFDSTQTTAQSDQKDMQYLLDQSVLVQTEMKMIQDQLYQVQTYLKLNDSQMSRVIRNKLDPQRDSIDMNNHPVMMRLKTNNEKQQNLKPMTPVRQPRLSSIQKN